jgi:protein-S-isoprenylcysteine O-methyltransferase Ste14
MPVTFRWQGKETIMDAARDNHNTPTIKGGPNPGLLRPPIIFLGSILLGIALNRAWPLNFVPKNIGWLGPLVTACAVVLFLLSYREFRAAGTSVRGSTSSTTIVRTGPYRFSRNPIYLAFIHFVLGLSVWWNNAWLLVTLVPAVGVIALVVIPREERFLERNFHDQYSSYKAAVRRWF